MSEPRHPGHYIVIGCGRVGVRVARELVRLGADVVVVNKDPDRFRDLGEDIEAACTKVTGDAIEAEVLAAADPGHAAGLASTLHLDRDNLFLCLNARHRYPMLRIVSRVGDIALEARFRAAGVDMVASPALMGGVRLARELLYPSVASWGDVLLASGERMVLLLPMTVVPTSEVVGQTLDQAELTRLTGCMIMGFKRRRARHYEFHPAGSTRLRGGCTLIALGEPRELIALRRIVEHRDMTALAQET